MEAVSVNKLLQLFNMLSRAEQLEIAEKINSETFEERWASMDKIMPDSKLSEDEIINEVRFVRYGEKENQDNFRY